MNPKYHRYDKHLSDIENIYSYHHCEFGTHLIEDAISVWKNEQAIAQFRTYLSECDMCYSQLDAEIALRHTLMNKTRERTPQNIRIKISETLGRITLNPETY